MKRPSLEKILAMLSGSALVGATVYSLKSNETRADEHQLVKSVSEKKERKEFLDLDSLEYITQFDKCEYDDPNQSGNRLFKVKEEDLEKYVSENFKLKEFVVKDGKVQEYARISPLLIDGLQKLRDRVKKPVIVTSGYRSRGRQLELIKEEKEASKKSRHMSGDAADITVGGYSGEELAKMARELFPNAGIGVGKSYIHLDFRGKRADWTYKN